MEEIKDLVVHTYSHRNTSLEDRDALSFSSDDIDTFTNHFREKSCEATVLSTCNRTEFYLYGSEQELSWQSVKRTIARIRQLSEDSIAMPVTLRGPNAARHLFRVSASLESLALGENQILGQVKTVHEQVLNSPGKSPVLDRLFQYAIRAGKLVRTHTNLCEGAISISSASVVLAQKIFGDFAKCRVLIVGAGDTATTAAMHFSSSGVTQFSVVNRGAKRGQALAQKFNGTYYPLEQLDQACMQSDIAVFATGSPNYLLTASQMKALMRSRSRRALFLIDISNPRNLDPQINRLDGVFLYNIDDLEQVVCTNMASRKQEVPEAEAIVEHMVNEWDQWLHAMQVTPTIATLARYFDEVREQELNRHHQNCSDSERAMLEEFSRGLIKKLLHHPISYLRSSVENKTLKHEDLHLVWSLYKLDMEDENSDET